MNLATDRGPNPDRTAAEQLRAAVFTGAVVAVLAGWPLAGRSQELTPAEAQTIAREAYIYGFPIVANYRTMYAFVIDSESEEYTAPFNTLKHEANVFTPADTDVVTPNADVLISLLWMDLRTEPLVLAVPNIEQERYYSIQLVDLYNFSFAYIGTRATGNNAGRYLIAGPNWQGEVPPNVDKVIRCESEFAMAMYRTQLRGPDDLDNVKEIQTQYNVQTLSDFLGQPSPEPAPVIEFPRPAATSERSLAFFSTLNFLLQFCPPHASETEVIARLARIGVTANALFDAARMSPELQEALKLGIAEGDAAITAAAAKLKVAEVIGTREYLNNDYLKRAVAAKLGRYSNSKEEALYPLYLTDAEGKPLEGSEANYVLRFRPENLPPVHAFWSVTVYDSRSQALVPNPINRYRVSSSMLPTLKRDADSGLTLYVQHESPAEDEVANWLPAASGPFYMVMRLYWPKPQAYDGTWTPPLVWREDAAPKPTIPKPAGAEAAEEVKPSVLVDEPNPEMERPTVWGEPTEVQIAIYVIDVDEINSADQSFAASVYFVAAWKNPFLRHQGPGPMHLGLTDVWNPRLAIVSQQMAWKSFPESVEIQPDGTVIYRQKVWGRFSQPLDLRDFPFDHQQLSLQIVAAGLREKHVKMVHFYSASGRPSGIADRFSLPDFTVVSWNASPAPYYAGREEDGIAGFEMKINVARQPSYYILKVIIPLCLIVVMSWLPRWMDPEQVGTNIGISTSSFLTLVAYLFAITVLLPRVSYVTRMDRFILLSTLTVFAGLIQTVANTVLVKGHRIQRAEQIERWSRIVYPVLLALVIAVSYVI